jgi:hypothetical protein
MNTRLPHFNQSVWKGSLMLISYFLFAACMQHDESLSPGNSMNALSNPDAALAGEVGTMSKRTFTAHLNAENETRDVESNAQGETIFRLSDDGSELYYKLIVANIDDVIVSHIHCGEVGQNGPPFVFLFSGPPKSGTFSGILAEGIITDNEILKTPCPGIETVEDLVNLIRAGGAYVNVHTLTHGPGEIRGQIK